MNCPNPECGMETLDGFCSECALEESETRDEPVKPRKRVVIGHNSLAQMAAILAMCAVPAATAKVRDGAACLCGFGTFRDTHASNCDEPRG